MCMCLYMCIFAIGVADYAESVSLIKIYFQDVVNQLCDIFYGQLNLCYFFNIFFEQDRSWACLCGTSTISTDSVCSSGRQTPHRYSKHWLVQMFYQPIGRSDYDNFKVQIYINVFNSFVLYCSTAKIWDIRNLKSGGKSNKWLDQIGHSKNVYSAYFSPLSGKYILTTSLDATLK